MMTARSTSAANRRFTAMFLAILCLFGSLLPAQPPDRSSPPQAGPPPSLSLPAIKHAALSNGIPVILMEKHQVPLVQLRIMLRAGIADDPEGLSGLAEMTASMMMEGAGGRSSLELADAIDVLGADISVDADYHTTTIDLHTPLSKLETALALLADVALRPAFPESELKRLRRERLTEMMQWHDQPRAIASVAAGKLVFGAGHPYGQPTIGNETSLRAMKTADIRSFYEKVFHAGNAVVIVSGDLTMESVKPMLDRLFGSWKAGEKKETPFPDAPKMSRRTITLVDKPGAAQSEIRITCVGARRSTDDYAALLVMNTILGGSFTSRLNQNLREQHGYTYGAASSFAFRLHPGPFTAASGVQTAVTDKALTEFMKELRGILEPVPEEELNRAKNYIAYGYPSEFQTVADLSGHLQQLAAFGLPDDYFNSFVRRILAVTKDDVKRVARKYLDPDRMAIVVVGDRAQIEKGLAALKLGPLTVSTIEEMLGKAPSLSGD
jgi:zinc protease